MVVTRFAPSPTGYLHIGGARTALFNWLFAKRMGGTFILRIEDTDQKRNTPTAVQQVMKDLRWLGIEWDQGPEVGGPNGPYLQSQRRDIYDKYIKKLLDEQKAYYCFDMPEELDTLRREAEARKKNFIYPRPEKFPGEKDVEKVRAEGRPVTVRFAIPRQSSIVVTDVVRGEVTFAAGEMSDFIIQKSDGFPTYNFACVVDDYLMKVTHVIRGQEHLMNTPGQQELWKALGFGELPKYAHMSVTVSEGSGKLSKREKPKKLREAIQPKATPEFIETISIHSAVDTRPGDVDTWPALSTAQVTEFINGKNVPDMPYIDKIAKFVGVHLHLLAKIIKACEGARTLGDIERKSRFLFIPDDQIEYDDKAVRKVLLKNDGLAVLQIVRDRLAAIELCNKENNENMLRGLAEEKQVGLGKIAQPLRVAICGTTISLPIFDSVEMLGKENTLSRIDNTLKKYETKP